MSTETKQVEPAKCRHCGLILKGKAAYLGGDAYHPRTGDRCPRNYYGGFVCSRECDYQASLKLERSMPGHGIGQKSISGETLRRVQANWGY